MKLERDIKIFNTPKHENSNNNINFHRRKTNSFDKNTLSLLLAFSCKQATDKSNSLRNSIDLLL